MKAYFYIKDLFQETVINNSDKYVCRISSVEVGGIEKLTSNYFLETSNNYEVPLNTWEFSDCTYNGTLINACGLSGISDSWNPFFSNLNASFDNVVNTKNRGGFLQSNSTNLYGIEGMGFGFDQIAVPAVHAEALAKVVVDHPEETDTVYTFNWYAPAFGHII